MTQARGVFPLPQTSPQIAGVPNAIALGSGAIYMIPPGNYLVSTGSNTVLQWFDPITYYWWPLGPAVTALRALNSDGTNYRLYNRTGTATQAAPNAPGSGGTNGIGPVQTGTTLAFDPSPTGQTAEGYVIIGGSVPAPTIVQGGSGFLVPPVICCDPPPVYGQQATFIATINASGAITAVTQEQAGAGYTSVPQFYIIPQPKYYQGMPRWPGDAPVLPWPAPGQINPANVWPGTVYQPNISNNGALIVGNALTGTGTLTGVTVTFNGGGYTAAPNGTLVGGTLTGASVIAVFQGGAAGNDISILQASVN